MDQVINKFCESPITFAIAFAITFLSIAFCIRLVGNPISYIVDIIKTLIPVAFKELRFKAGRAGVVNIIIVFSITLLTLVVLTKPNFSAIIQPESDGHFSEIIILLAIDIVAFLVSLVLVLDLDKFTNIFKKNR